MGILFEVKPVDHRFYAERLRDFLPDRMIDIHTHLWLARHKTPPGNEPLRAVTWPARVARDNSADDMEETYRLMFPGKSVTPLVFGNMLSAGDDERGGNEYVGASAAARN